MEEKKKEFVVMIWQILTLQRALGNCTCHSLYLQINPPYPLLMYCSNRTNGNVSNVYHKIISRHFCFLNMPPFKMIKLKLKVILKQISVIAWFNVNYSSKAWLRFELMLNRNIVYDVYSCLPNELRLIVMSLNEDTSPFHSYFYK